MAMTDQTQVIALLASILHGDAWPTLPSAWKMKLGSTVPTNTAAMTELPNGSGYSTGGQTIAIASVTTANPTLPSAAVSWTNGSGSAWDIAGLEIVDQVPARWLEGAWTGEPVAVANGNTFQVAANAVEADASQW